MELFLPCLYAFLACLGFCVLFRINGLGAVLCSLGGALAWLVYLLTGPIMGNNDVIQYFWAAVFLSAYAEVMARVRKCPATGYLLIAFIPLVPGAGIYNMMDAALRGNTQDFLNTGLHTLSIAGSLAVGVLVVSSLVRMYSML
ncbi:threonine/serine exporter family protein [uncultured Intestinimonas sp.]|nr:threonine/serine exporter family protein [uncultured Intestinimonas sp.]